MTFRLFGTKPRCVECGTHDHLHVCEDGIHGKAYVCSTCAILTGYVDFLPELAAEIQQEMETAKGEFA